MLILGFECAHYVNGGWSPTFSSFFQGDKYLFFFLFAVSLCYTYIYYFLIQKK